MREINEKNFETDGIWSLKLERKEIWNKLETKEKKQLINLALMSLNERFDDDDWCEEFIRLNKWISKQEFDLDCILLAIHLYRKCL